MRQKLYLFLGVLCFLFNLQGQIVINRTIDSISLINNRGVKAVYGAVEEDFSSILEKEWRTDYDSTFFTPKDKNLWLSFTVLNKDTFNSSYYIYVPECYFSIYIQKDTGWVHKKNGYFVPFPERDYKKNCFFLPIILPYNQPVKIYLKMKGNPFLHFQATPILYNKAFYYQDLSEYTQYNQKGAIINLIYLAGLSIIFFFILVIFLYIKKDVYLYYLLFLFFQIIYGCIIYARTPFLFLNIGLYFPILGYQIIEGVQFIFVGFYILFILKLLQIKKYSLPLAKAMKWLAYVTFIYALFSIVYLSAFPTFNGISFSFFLSRVIILPINLVLIAWTIIKVKHPLLNYFIFGNIFFFLGSILSVYISLNFLDGNPNSIFYFVNSPNTIFQIGLLGEVLCFSFAIAHHIRIIQKEREQSAKAYINQLKKMQRVQKEANSMLDKKVKIKTGELIKVYSEMEMQKQKEMEADFSEKIKEMEMLVLRTQMNPHFLFNSLNAIKFLIVKGKKEIVVKYLDDFSKLLRNILQNSRKESITVEDELEVLELYLSLEKHRLGEEFSYTIQTNDKPALSQYEIPSLLLQPFIENAIWHGVMPSNKSDKKISIEFLLSNTLTINILDNGIGREASKNQNKKGINLKKSFGIEITQKRLAVFNHLHDTNITLKIIDLAENGAATGTKVTFTYSK